MLPSQVRPTLWHRCPIHVSDYCATLRLTPRRAERRTAGVSYASCLVVGKGIPLQRGPCTPPQKHNKALLCCRPLALPLPPLKTVQSHFVSCSAIALSHHARLGGLRKVDMLLGARPGEGYLQGGVAGCSIRSSSAF